MDLSIKENFYDDLNNVKFKMPNIVVYDPKDRKKHMSYKYEEGKTKVKVVCVKYGTKYGADYVNKLYYGVKKNLSIEHSFHCFTENEEGLDKNIGIIPLNNHWQAWWSKVNIFDGKSYADTETNQIILYIDLDMIISGNLDSLILNFDGHFSTLTTNDIFCE